MNNGKTIDIARLELSKNATPVLRSYMLGYARGKGFTINTSSGGLFWYMERTQADDMAALFPNEFVSVDDIGTAPFLDELNTSIDTGLLTRPANIDELQRELAFTGIYTVAYYKAWADNETQLFIFSNGPRLTTRDAAKFIRLMTGSGINVAKCHSRDEFVDVVTRHHIPTPDGMLATLPHENAIDNTRDA